MAEQLINEFTVNRPIDEAWTILTDIERIAPCLPGAELQEVEGETYRGVVKVKLGAISSQFKGEANFIDRDDPNYTATIKGVGRDTGGRGNASAEINAKAESLSPTSTKVIVTTDLHITGKVAQFGRGIMGDVSAKLMGQFANNLNEMLDEQGLDGGPDGPGRRTRPLHRTDHRARRSTTARRATSRPQPRRRRSARSTDRRPNRSISWRSGAARSPSGSCRPSWRSSSCCSSSAAAGVDGRPDAGRRATRTPATRRVRSGGPRRRGRPRRRPQPPVPRRRHPDADALLPRRTCAGARRQPARSGRRRRPRRARDRRRTDRRDARPLLRPNATRPSPRTTRARARTAASAAPGSG